MKRTKKMLALLLAFVLMSSMLVACGNDSVTPETTDTNDTAGDDAGTEEPDETEEADDADASEAEPQGEGERLTQEEVLALAPTKEPSGTVIIGDITQLDANFATDWWTNSASNNRIRDVIFGYELTTYTEAGETIFDPVVVKDYEEIENADGSLTYKVTIYDNLKWNDGTGITAKDYVFSMLLAASPQLVELEGAATAGMILTGYTEFNSGESKTFSGVHLIDEYTLSITVAAEELPSYYVLTEISTFLMPMHVIAPDADVVESEEGAAFSDDVTTDLLKETIEGNGAGYRYNPTVTAGPYKLEKYDPGTDTATLAVNDQFLAKYDGAKAQIETIIIKLVEDATMMDELATGSVDILGGVNGGTRIEKGLDLADDGTVTYVEYPRAGYGKVAFHCDFGPTQFAAVRQAVAQLLDRDEFARTYTGGYGIVVNGYYGAATPEYIASKDILDEKLNTYPKNTEAAKELLIADGWTLNETGAEFVEGTDAIRYKDVDGELMPLVIEWFATENNPVADLLVSTLPDAAAEVGMKINQTIGDFATLLQHYYRTSGEQVYSMFNLATGFVKSSPVWYYYSDDENLMGQYNSNFIVDEELLTLVNDMKATDSDDWEGWLEKWVPFQIRWNELLPDIPLYSDLYYDFFSPKIQDYSHNNSIYGYTECLLRAYVEE